MAGQETGRVRLRGRPCGRNLQRAAQIAAHVALAFAFTAPLGASAAAADQGAETVVAWVGSGLPDGELGRVDTAWDRAGSGRAAPARRPLPERLVFAARDALESGLSRAGLTRDDAEDAAPSAPQAGALAGEDDAAQTHSSAHLSAHRWLTDAYRVD